MRFIPPALAFVALFTLIGCGGGGGASPCGDGGPVVLPPAPPAMVSPAPGATGLPSSVTIQVSYAPPDGTLRAVANGTGATIAGSAFSAAPATTPPTSAVVSTLSALAPHTTYTVYVDAVYPPAQPCFQGERAGPTTFDLGAISTL